MFAHVAIIPVVAVAFVATNLDNFALLVTLLAQYRHNSSTVIAGYLCSAALIGLAGFLAGTAANTAPVEYLGYLGLIPVSLGIVGIVRLLRNNSQTEADRTSSPASRGSVFLAVLFTQLSNGVDTLVTVGVLFADSLAAADPLIGITFAGMGMLFVITALFAVRRPQISDTIDRYADRVTPFILLLVGVYVLLNTGTDVLK